MTRAHLLVLLPFLAACKGCEERQAARAAEERQEQADELREAMAPDGPFVVFAEQVARGDGGSEAWGRSDDFIELRPPEGVAVVLTSSMPDWVPGLMDHECPNDVPMTWLNTSSDGSPITNDHGMSTRIVAGGCNVAGGDITGQYDTGFMLEFTATVDGSPGSFSFSLPVEVELAIE